MNWTHSGVLLTAAGFVWVMGVVIVLVMDAAMNAWAGCMLVAISIMFAGRMRRH